MSSDSFSNPANLDPRLRDDPVMEFLTTAQQYTETHNPGADGDQSEENDEDVPARIQVSTQGDGQNSFIATSSMASSITAIGQIIKRIKKFEGKFETEFDNYCAVSLIAVIISCSCSSFFRQQMLRNVSRCTLPWISRFWSFWHRCKSLTTASFRLNLMSVPLYVTICDWSNTHRKQLIYIWRQCFFPQPSSHIVATFPNTSWYVHWSVFILIGLDISVRKQCETWTLQTYRLRSMFCRSMRYCLPSEQHLLHNGML